MNITFAGDWHGTLYQALNAVDKAVENGSEIIIHLGDFGIWKTSDRYLKGLNNALKKADIKLYFVDGNHECVDDKTRAITPQGFADYSSLRKGDLVLSVDDDGNRVWQPIQDIIIKDYVGDMVSVKSRGMDMLLTPNHRVVYQSHRGKWKEVLAQDLNGKGIKNIHRAVSNPLPDADISDDMIRLYAWCITDGHHRQNGGWHLYQRESSAPQIRGILDRLGIPYGESTRVRDITHIMGKELKSKPQPEVTFRISAEEGRKLHWNKKEIWDEVWNWSERQVDIFLTEVVFCDGSWGGASEGMAGVIYCTPPERRESLRLLATLNGWRTSEYTPREGDYRLNISKHSVSAIHKNTQISRETYSGKVWCVTVPNGRFFAERGGKTFLTGNCFPMLYAYPIQEDGTRKVRSNIFHLPRGYQFTLDDLSFTAFGGAFSVDRQHRKLNESYWHEELASPEEIDYVLTLPETDILLMHDCPAGLPNFITDDPQAQIRGMQLFGVNAIEQANQYREILRPIPEHLNPTHVFHGHYHVNTARYYQKPDPAKGHGKVICLDEGGAGTLYNLMHTSTDLLKEERNRLRDVSNN